MPTLRRTLLSIALLIVGLPLSVSAQEMDQMGGMGKGYVPDSLSRAKLAPLVKGYYKGGEAFFIHTEASDEKVAGMLTKMMGPTVLHMPALAKTPEALRAPIYVFKNGIEGTGPFGHQPDVLGAVPGDEGYSPLHEIHLVRWTESAEPRELRSAAALKEAQANGALTIEATGTVVNSPVLAWPGGHR
ncbi:MAG: hypothetical protein ABEL51_11920 [Salinibacter sp.]